MKTPEEIKKGLGRPVTVHYHNDPEPRLTPRVKVELEQLHDAALAYTLQLEQIALHWQSSMDQVQKALQDNGFGSLEEFLQAFSQVKRDRDAAVKILTDIAHHTDWFGGVGICAACKKDKCKECGSVNGGFEWRGAPEQEKNEPIRAD